MWYNKLIMDEKNYLGVDIGTTSIKIAEFIRTQQGIHLENYGILETFTNSFQTSGFIASDSDISAYLRIILQHSKVKSRKAIASLPAFFVSTSLIDLPTMPEAEVGQAMAFQAQQYVPWPIAAVSLDYIKVGERVDENQNKIQQMFLIAVPNEQIERYHRIFGNAGLDLQAVEIEGVSLARIFTQGVKEAALIIDIGGRSTSFFVVQDGILKFTAHTDFAGDSLTQAIAEGLGVSPRRAEELKRKIGLLSGKEFQLSTHIKPLLDVIINEAGRAKENFERSYQATVKNVILTGGGSNLSGLEDYYSKQTGLKVVKANPFGKISYPQAIESLIKELSSSVAIVLGLSARE